LEQTCHTFIETLLSGLLAGGEEHGQ
jgi:hypothetical protein